MPGRLFAICLMFAAVPGVASAQLEIVRAIYGAGGLQENVTERVRAFVQNDGLHIEVNPETMGGDPMPGVQKTLVVEYREGWRYRTVRAVDFGVIRIGNTAGLAIAKTAPMASAGGLSLRSAHYGAGTRVADVTETLRRLVDNGRLELTVSAATLGVDPAPGMVKMLRVEYVLDGQEMTKFFGDGESVRLAAAGAGGSSAAVSAPIPDHGGWRILAATYGDGAAARDVTQALRQRVQDGRLVLFVAPFNLGVDAPGGGGGTLRADCEVDGKRRTVTAADGETLRLPVHELQVVAALYGVPGRQVDVREEVARQLATGGAQFLVSGQNLGGDPAPGEVKTLHVTYEVDGVRKMAQARDGELFQTERAGAVEQAAGPMINNGVCFYRGLDFHGQPWCVRTGQSLPDVRDSFLSMRVSGGPRTVEIYEEAGYRGRKVVLNGNERDLMATGAWWRYETAARIGSIRVR